ncbi:MAG TPA: LysM peptidoglycan-binding domain-containing protein [Verrucomicrobiae bacterium]|jgi:D-gamma-glutamyl-meso-diaminopimelic acid endopeptidase CwlS|nr:LysM peptidoglycan-binding domain-containing protein [Verrucomicrobiae bacterium]
MSTPSPLIPQGTFQAQASKGASNVRIAVATIVAIHLVFFGGLLLQGCKRDTKTGSASGDTNNSTNLSLPPIDSSALYSTSSARPSTESSNNFASSGQNSGSNASAFAEAPGNANTTPEMWKPNNLATNAVAEQQSGATKDYVVVRGDNFGKIAKLNGTTVAALKKANPNVDPAKIHPGMKINLPVAGGSSAATASATAQGSTTPETAATGNAGDGTAYTVKAGDTLTKIAKTHGVTVGQLRSANNLKTGRINVGQKLTIPVAGSASTAPSEPKPTKAHAHAHKTTPTNNTSTNLAL